jgi:YopX protein
MRVLRALARFHAREPREVRYEGCGFIPLAGWMDQALKDMQWEVIGNIYENPELLGR